MENKKENPCWACMTLYKTPNKTRTPVTIKMNINDNCVRK